MEGKEEKAAIGDGGSGWEEGGKEGEGRGGGVRRNHSSCEPRLNQFKKIFRSLPVFRDNCEVKSGRSYFKKKCRSSRNIFISYIY